MHHSLSIYKASAGSGKTFTLTVEYILLLLTGGEGEFRHTLAVTFTNKATAEMKNRIIETLYGLAHSLPDSDKYLHAIMGRLSGMDMPMDGKEIRERSGDTLSAILHDYTNFRVETIDSFFQTVMRNMAHELGLNANLQVEIDDKETISRAVDRMIENMHEDRQLQTWLLSYVQNRMENNEKWNIASAIKEFARCIFTEEYQQRDGAYKEMIADQEAYETFYARMWKIIHRCTLNLDKAATKVEDCLTKGDIQPDMVKYVDRYYKFIDNMRCKGDFSPPSATVKYAAGDAGTILKKEYASADDYAEAAEQLSEAIDEAIRVYQTEVRTMFTAMLCLKHLEPLRLLSHIEKEVNAINTENNQFILSRTPALLGKLIEGNDAPFVFEKAGTQFHNVMIDEFQDTSRQQWNNFRILLLENQSTGGNSLLVGDIKQSIYRWRGGDWEILGGVADELRSLGPKCLELQTNYRSLGNIVGFNNAFFPKAAEMLDGLSQEGFRICNLYTDVRQHASKESHDGCVKVRIYKDSNEYQDEMAEDVYRCITNLLGKGVRASDIAILVRKNHHASDLIERFREFGCPFSLVSEEAFLLGASVAVRMIVYALRWLSDKTGEDPIPERYLILHYMQDVLRQPVDITRVATMQAADILPAELVGQGDRLLRLPLYLLCERLCQILGLASIPGQDVYLFTFFDQVQGFVRTSPSDVRTFLKTCDEQLLSVRIPAASTDGIRILTIHKSKGLQFHTVLLPYNDWDIERDRPNSNDILWCEADSGAYSDLGPLPITPCKMMENSEFARYHSHEHLQRRIDALNLIYVAFTRAESNLFVWGRCSKKDNSLSTVGDLISRSLPEGWADEGDAITYGLGSIHVGGDDGKGKVPAKESNRLCEDPSTFVPFPIKMASVQPRYEFMQSNSSRRFIEMLGQCEGNDGAQSYAEIGEAMHDVLSHVRYMADLDKALLQCEADGRIADERQLDFIRQRISNGFADSLISRWFSPSCRVFCEASISYIDPTTGTPAILRPDRVVMDGDNVTVVDYKFGTPHPGHISQVEGYMSCMSHMYPNCHVRGFLWYIYSGKVMEVKA